MRGGRRGRASSRCGGSDLRVIATIDLPPLPGGGGDEQPGEPRVLSDGRTVLVSTFTCGLYGITGLGGVRAPSPSTASRAAAARCRSSGTGSGSSRCRARMPSSHSTFPNPGDPVEYRASSSVAELPALARARRGSNRIVIADRGDGEEAVTSRVSIPAPARFPSTSGSAIRAPIAPAFRSSARSGRTAAPAPRGRTDRSSDRVGDERPRHSPRPDGDGSASSPPPDRWDDVVALFGERGACAGCWCMYWRREAQAYATGKGAGNRAALRRIVRRGTSRESPAYADGEPIGWCAVASARSTRDSIARASWRGWTTRPCGRSRACSWRGRGGGAGSARP